MGIAAKQHVGTRGKECVQTDDRHCACRTVLIKKHGHGVISVEEYERLSVRPDGVGKAGKRAKGANKGDQ